MRAQAGRWGQSLTEFALILPLLSMLLVGTVDLARVFYAKMTIANASRVAAEYAANYQEARGFRWMSTNQYRDAIKLPGSVADPCVTQGSIDCGKERATLAARWTAVRETTTLGIGLSDVSMSFNPPAAADGDWEPNTQFMVTVTYAFTTITPLASSLWGGGALSLTHFTELRHSCAINKPCTYS